MNDRTPAACPLPASCLVSTALDRRDCSPAAVVGAPPVRTRSPVGTGTIIARSYDNDSSADNGRGRWSIDHRRRQCAHWSRPQADVLHRLDNVVADALLLQCNDVFGAAVPATT